MIAFDDIVVSHPRCSECDSNVARCTFLKSLKDRCAHVSPRGLGQLLQPKDDERYMFSSRPMRFDVQFAWSILCSLPRLCKGRAHAIVGQDTEGMKKKQHLMQPFIYKCISEIHLE